MFEEYFAKLVEILICGYRTANELVEMQVGEVEGETFDNEEFPDYEYPSLCILSAISNFKHQVLRCQDNFDVLNENGLISEALFTELFEAEWMRFLKVYETSAKIPTMVLKMVLGVHYEYHMKMPKVTAESFLIYFDWNMSLGLQDYRTE